MEATTKNQNLTIWNIPVLSREQFSTLTPFERLQYIVHFGTLAPNTHNAQPWAFFLSPETFSIHVYLDRSRVLPASDKEGRQSMVSIGCTLQNMMTTAEYYGKKGNFILTRTEKKDFSPLQNSGEKRYTEVGILSFEETEKITLNPNTEHLFLSILHRKVIRADYDREKQIDPALIQEIQTTAMSKRVELHLIQDAVRRQAIAEFQGQADGYVINSKKFSRELGDWLLPNNTNSNLGMPGIGFGLQDEEAQRIHRGLIGETKLEPEDGLKFALSGKMGMEKSPFIGFITAEKDEPEYWIEVGQALENIFLLCAQNNIATAVHAGIVEVSLINRIFAATLGTTKKIIAVFRLGYVKNSEDANRPHAPRLPVEEVILKTKI